MLAKLKNWFNKENESLDPKLPVNESASFVLKVDDVVVGYLRCDKGIWEFTYSAEFKKQAAMYKPIVGFPNLDEVYKSEYLWPFFKIRIPGLNQPSVKQIIEHEHIDLKNEVALLKRFGFKSISNPYVLEFS